MSKNQTRLPEEKTSKKHNWKKYGWLIFFALLIFAIGAVYRFAQKPAEGIIKSAKQESKAEQIISAKPEKFQGKYVSFVRSSDYILKSTELAKDSTEVILERAYFSETNAVFKKISLTVRSLPSRNLEDDPDYLMRVRNPERYRKENFSLDTVQGISFVPADDGQFEKTFFILNNDLVATLSMTAPAVLDEKLNRTADEIVKTLTWQK